MTEVYDFDVVIIGAGLVGLAVARELSSVYDNIILVEKESSFGQHVSSHNSEVIHSGIYYPKDALKTKLCVEGNKLLYKFAQKYDIPHKKCGKLIVATCAEEEPILDQLYEQGKKNAVVGMSMIGKSEIAKIEPAVKATKALHVESTGIIDSHSVMQLLEASVLNAGVITLYNTEITSIDKKNNIYKLTTDTNNDIIQTRIVINAAGLWSDTIAAMVGINDYKIHWCKGEYYKTNKHRNMKKLIYPVPDPQGKYLGIHTVLDLNGGLLFGPNAYYVDNLSYDMKENNKSQFYEAINRYLDIGWCEIEPALTGIRPKLQAPGEKFRDFVIENNQKHENFINIVGIESPGLTACLAIAKHTRGIIR